VVKLVLLMQQTLDFTAVDSFRVEEHLSIVIWLGEHWGRGGSAVEVVMVIMTSFSMPTGDAHSCSTGKIIFVLVLVGQVCSGIPIPSTLTPYNYGCSISAPTPPATTPTPNKHCIICIHHKSNMAKPPHHQQLCTSSIKCQYCTLHITLEH